MPGCSLDKSDVSILREKLPDGVLDVLSEEELRVFRMLSIGGLDPNERKEIRMSLARIISSVRSRVFCNKPLPPDFPRCLRPIADVFNEYSSDIGVIIDGDKIDPAQVEKWVFDTLSAHSGLSIDKVKDILTFKGRIWFDGKATVQIILRTAVDEIKESLLSPQK